jgi:hypothetical protein
MAQAFPDHALIKVPVVPSKRRNSQETNGTGEAFPFRDHDGARIFGARGHLLAVRWQSHER